jgi:predicted membrane protein
MGWLGGLKAPIWRSAFPGVVPGGLLAAGASRTYRRAFPAANGLSGTSGALESLAGNPYPPIHA